MKSTIPKIKSTLKRVKNPVIRERLLMVQEAYKNSLRDAATMFGYTHGKIAYWKNRYKNHGLKGLNTKPRSGRPKKITPQQEKIIKRKVRKHNPKRGWRTMCIKTSIFEESGVRYSARQVIRIAQSWGLAQIKPRQRYAYSKKEDREEFIKKTAPS
jgi:transposase